METTASIRSFAGAAPPPAGGLANAERLLVDRCLAGDQTAAEELVVAHSPMVYGIGIRLAGRPEDAEDLVQDVFLRVFRSLSEFRGDCPLRSWIAAIAVNQTRNRVASIVRFRKTFTSVASDPDSPDDDPLERVADPAEPGAEHRLLAEEKRRLVAAAIGELPPEFREAVVLRDQQGLAYDEIARATGVPVGTVRSRLARGRAMLARRLRVTLGPTTEESRP